MKKHLVFLWNSITCKNESRLFQIGWIANMVLIFLLAVYQSVCMIQLEFWVGVLLPIPLGLFSILIAFHTYKNYKTRKLS